MSIDPVNPPPNAPLQGMLAALRPAGGDAEPDAKGKQGVDGPTADGRRVAGGDPVAAAQAAGRRIDEMIERGRELHFRVEDGQIRIDVYDGRGRLIREIPPNEALREALGEGSTWRA